MNSLKSAAICLLVALSVSGAEDSAPGRAKDNSYSVAEESKELDRLERLADALNSRSLSSSTHKLVEGDVIEIKVYQEEELNTKARVDSDGAVAMPLLGLINLRGKTVEQAQLYVRGLLEKDFLKNPEVSLAVTEFAKKRFSIVGEVNAPGFYQFPEGERMSLLQAVAMAGGMTPFARSGKVTIKRVAGGKESVLHGNIKDMAQKQKKGVMEIQAGDAILVHQSLF